MLQITLIILVVVFLSTSVFLGKEMMKKFGFLSKFAQKSPGLLLTWKWPGAQKLGKKKGMRNIVLRGKKPFSILVGFELAIKRFGKGFDYYGFASSDAENFIIVVETYLGNGEVKFQFLKDSDVEVSISSTDEDQLLEPTVSYPPHWWQTLGFFG